MLRTFKQEEQAGFAHNYLLAAYLLLCLNLFFMIIVTDMVCFSCRYISSVFSIEIVAASQTNWTTLYQWYKEMKILNLSCLLQKTDDLWGTACR